MGVVEMGWNGKTNKPTKEWAKKKNCCFEVSQMQKNCNSKKKIECKQMFKTINGNNKCKLTCALSQVKKLHDAE